MSEIWSKYVYSQSFYPFRCQWTGGNCWSTAKSFELSVNNLAIFIDFDLQFHDITTSRCSHQTSANIFVCLVHRADIPWILIMIQYLQKFTINFQLFWSQIFWEIFHLHFCGREQPEGFELDEVSKASIVETKPFFWLI